MVEQQGDILTRAWAASQQPTTSREELRALRRELHGLAEQQDLPARAFFEACLAHLDRRWRDLGLTCLGFHYPLQDSPVLARIRYLLVEDPAPDVRMAAARILGNYPDAQLPWPEWGLVSALRQDPVIEVRMSAIEALLTHAAAPYEIIQGTVSQIRRGELGATTDTLKHIVLRERLAVPVDELDSSGVS